MIFNDTNKNHKKTTPWLLPELAESSGSLILIRKMYKIIKKKLRRASPRPDIFDISGVFETKFCGSIGDLAKFFLIKPVIYIL